MSNGKPPPRDPDRLGGSLVGVGASDVHERALLVGAELVGLQVDAVVHGAAYGTFELARVARR